MRLLIEPVAEKLRELLRPLECMPDDELDDRNLEQLVALAADRSVAEDAFLNLVRTVLLGRLPL